MNESDDKIKRVGEQSPLNSSPSEPDNGNGGGENGAENNIHRQPKTRSNRQKPRKEEVQKIQRITKPVAAL